MTMFGYGFTLHNNMKLLKKNFDKHGLTIVVPIRIYLSSPLSLCHFVSVSPLNVIDNRFDIKCSRLCPLQKSYSHVICCKFWLTRSILPQSVLAYSFPLPHLASFPPCPFQFFWSSLVFLQPCRPPDGGHRFWRHSFSWFGVWVSVETHALLF